MAGGGGGTHFAACEAFPPESAMLTVEDGLGRRASRSAFALAAVAAEVPASSGSSFSEAAMTANGANGASDDESASAAAAEAQRNNEDPLAGSFGLAHADINTTMDIRLPPTTPQPPKIPHDKLTKIPVTISK